MAKRVRRAAAVLAVALAAVALADCSGSKPAQQRVRLVAGGGPSRADAGHATDLHLPQHITALTVAPDGTIWLAGRSEQFDLPQIVSITTDGMARRIDLPGNLLPPSSLAATPDGSVYAVGTRQPGIWRVSGDRLVPAWGASSPSYDAPGPPFVADGAKLAGGRLGSVVGLAVDSTGRLDFEEVQDDYCALIRQVRSDGTVRTLAGHRCRSKPTPVDTARSTDPATNTPPGQLLIGRNLETFAAGPNGQILLATNGSVISVTSAGARLLSAASGGVPDDDEPTVPVGDKPLASSARASSVRMNPPAFSNTSVAAAPDGSVAVISGQTQEKFGSEFTWRAESGSDRVTVPPSRLANAVNTVVLLIRGGQVTTASVVGDAIAFGRQGLLVAASRDDGAVVALVPTKPTTP